MRSWYLPGFLLISACVPINPHDPIRCLYDEARNCDYDGDNILDWTVGGEDECDLNPDRITPVPVWPDGDGDGFGDSEALLVICNDTEFAQFVSADSGPPDCDDMLPGTNPDAQEICDTIDNDCDGQVDNGFDSDLDTFTRCTGDCNDEDASIHPGALEPCDGVDNNCDSRIDENSDADGDHFTTCAGDCDDVDAEVHPDADETCNDGHDQDCTAACALNPTIRLESLPERLRFPGSAEHLGLLVADLNCDKILDLVVASPYDDALNDDAGVLYFFPGPLEDQQLSPDDASFKIAGTGKNEKAGSSLTAGDLIDDGSGCDELVIGAPGAAGTAQAVSSSGSVLPAAVTSAGAVYVLSLAGPHPPTLVLPAEANPDDDIIRLEGDGEYAKAGTSVSSGRDVNGDGHPDLLLGAPGAFNTLGAGFLMLGPLSEASEGSVASAYAALIGTEEGEAVADSVLLLRSGAVVSSRHGNLDRGGFYWVEAVTGGAVPLASQHFVSGLEQAAFNSRTSLARGDFYADGTEGLILGVSGGSSAGNIYLFTELDALGPDLSSAALILTDPVSNGLGSSILFLPEFDDVGGPVIAAGAPDDDLVNESAGAIYLFFLDAAADELLLRRTVRVQSTVAGAAAGVGLACFESPDAWSELLIAAEGIDGVNAGVWQLEQVGE